MEMAAIPFGTTDWSQVERTEHAGERGLATWRTRTFGDGACTDEMAQLAGAAGEGLACSQAGLPAAAASREFLQAFNAKYGPTKLYAPFYYDATNVVIEAMRKADSTDPARFTPEIYKLSHQGATGRIEFDAKGDRKDAEMTIFKLQGGKVVPISIVKGGVATPFTGAAPAPAAAAPAAAAPAAPAAEPKKEEPKKDEKKK